MHCERESARGCVCVSVCLCVCVSMCLCVCVSVSVSMSMSMSMSMSVSLSLSVSVPVSVSMSASASAWCVGLCVVGDSKGYMYVCVCAVLGVCGWYLNDHQVTRFYSCMSDHPTCKLHVLSRFPSSTHIPVSTQNLGKFPENRM